MTEINKKKLLLVITKSNWGGAQRYVYDLASELGQEYDVTVALGGNGELKEKLDNAYIKTAPIPYLERDINLGSDFRVFFGLIKLFESLSPDIIHLNSSKIGGLGSLAGRFHNLRSKHRARIVFTAHGWTFNENRGPLQKDFIKFLHWITILLSDQTICVSRGMANQIKNFTLVQHKISVIHNGVSQIPFYKKGEAQEEIIGRSLEMQEFFGLDLEKRKKTIWIGSVSELHKNKGLEYCIHALSELKKEYPFFIFVVFGEGEERNNLQNLIREKKLDGQVILFGKIIDAVKYLHVFNIFTLSSITEGLPYAILEAGLAELPVIASNVGGIPEVVDQLHSGILARPKEPHEIKEALAFIIENKDKRKELATNLKQKIETDFSLDKMIEETRKVYEG